MMISTERHGSDAGDSQSRRLFRTLLKLTVSVGLVAALVAWVDWRSVSHAILTADREFLILALVCIVPTVPLSAWRWERCTRASRITLPARFYVHGTYAACFVGQFLPAGLGVDAARLGYFVHGRAPLGQALQSLMLDRIVGVVSVVFVLAVGLPAIWSLLPPVLVVFSLALVGATLIGIGAVFVGGRWRWAHFEVSGRLRKLVDVLLSVRRSIISRETAGAFAISCGIYCLMILGVYFFARALAEPVSYISLLAVVAVAMFLAALPVSVNGWGIRESAMVTGLSALSISSHHALAISLLFGCANAVVTLPGAFMWNSKPKHGAARNRVGNKRKDA